METSGNNKSFGVFNTGSDIDDKKCSTNSRYVSDLRPIEEIPHLYQKIYSNYPCFNYVQSVTFDDLFYTDDSIVVSAPTGSGKTTIFELAVIKALITYEGTKYQDTFKMVYISPMKALCEERLIDWHRKFSEYGVNCISVTGDSDNIDIKDLICNNLIITTPERWDSLTRKWKDNQQFVASIKLFMIDEIHLLGDDSRGAVLEIIVCRMKTIENSLKYYEDSNKIRFVAVSATIPNIEDIAEWIDGKNVKYFKFSDDVRPVKLRKIVNGYYYNPKSTYFKFDLALNYKLQNLILQYSEGKPTLIFCSTRKIAEMTAQHLIKNLTINLTAEQKEHLQEAVLKTTDGKIKEVLIYGIGYHHAGMLPETKSLIENLFRTNNLPILVTTSTLSLGINLPAHLVIIKSTKMYQNGQFTNYTDTTILQMIGRAGRPQYDQTATAIILTTQKDKEKYEKLFENTQIIESKLHKHLIEHLNAEICLSTITNLDVAMLWLTSTFLYIRARKQPKFYGIHAQNPHQIDKKLLEMCQIELNKLAKAKMLSIDINMNLEPTLTGYLMAKYYLAFETVKLFTQLKGDEILQQILNLISKCHEFSEMYLRVNDKKCLNLLNKCKNRQTIRFPLKGKIKTLDMKINCLIQAVLGCLDITDHSLLAETLRIMRNAERIIKGLIEYLETINKYQALLNSIILSKCFKAKLWEDSPYVTKQLTGIGNVISKQLVDKGKTTFDILLKTNPRELEIIINKKPPLGDRILDEIKHLPQYSLKINRINAKQFEIIIILENSELIDNQSTININSLMYLLIGDSSNNIILYEKYTHSYMTEHPQVVRNFEIDENTEFIQANFISDDWVGIDAVNKLELMPKKDTENSIKKSKEVLKPKNDVYLQTFIDKYMKIKKQITNNNKEMEQKAKNFNKVDKIVDDKENISVDLNQENSDAKPDIEIYGFASQKRNSVANILKKNDNSDKGNISVDLTTDNSDAITKPDIGIYGFASQKPNRVTSIYKKNDNSDKGNISVDLNKENSDAVAKVDKDKYRLASQTPNIVANIDKKTYDCDKENISIESNKKKSNAITKLDMGKYRFAPKKLSHQQSDVIEEILQKQPENDQTNPTKKIKLNDENCDNTDKNVKWRSPLIYSPPVKFSPKLNFNNKISNSDEERKNDEIVDKNSVETSTCSTISNELLLKPSLSQQQKLRSSYFLPTIKLNPSKSGTVLPLSDKDSMYEDDNSSTLSIEDRDSFFSSSFLEKIGIKAEREERSQLQYQQSQRNDRIKSKNIPTVDCYSELVSQGKSFDNSSNNTDKKKRIVDDLQRKSPDIVEFNFERFNKRLAYSKLLSTDTEPVVSMKSKQLDHFNSNYRNLQTDYSYYFKQHQQQESQFDNFSYNNYQRNFDNNLPILPPPSSLPIINRNYQQMNNYPSIIYDGNNFDNSSYSYLRRTMDLPSPINENMMMVNHRYGFTDSLQMPRMRPQSQPLPPPLPPSPPQQQQWNFQPNFNHLSNYFYQQNPNLYNPQQQQHQQQQQQQQQHYPQQQEMLKNFIEQDYRSRQLMMEKFLKSVKQDQQDNI